MNILICGGAGYIGSHMAKSLFSLGHKITIFDNLSTGHQEAVQWGKFIKGDLLDVTFLESVFNNGNFHAVMHFSAKSLVGESMANPAIYYSNNVTGTLNLLNVMQSHDVDKFVFSSSAATFGNPVKDLIDERHPQEPINPYGRTKLMVEHILQDYASANNLCSVSLRYFNAAGADPDGEIGESHQPETHLIPNVMKALLDGGGRLKVFGNDYATKDGTCVRDYIHINDLCEAHLLALEYMNSNAGAHGFNLGNGQGFSIMEVIDTTEQVTDMKVPYDFEGRRSGDPPTLVADSSYAQAELGWHPHHRDLSDIIRTAWHWHNNQKF